MEGFYEQLRSSIRCQNRAYNELTNSGYDGKPDVYEMLEFPLLYRPTITVFKTSDEEPSVNTPIYKFLISFGDYDCAIVSSDLYYTEFNCLCHALSTVIYKILEISNGRNNKVQNG